MTTVTGNLRIPSSPLLLWFLYGSLLWSLVQSSTLPEESTPTDQTPENSSNTVQYIQDTTTSIESGFPFQILILVIVLILLCSLGVWFYVYQCRRKSKTRSKNTVSCGFRNSTPGSSTPSSKSRIKGTPSNSTNSVAVSVVEKSSSFHLTETPSPEPSMHLVYSEDGTSAAKISSRDIYKTNSRGGSEKALESGRDLKEVKKRMKKKVVQKTQTPWTKVSQSKYLRPKTSFPSKFSIKYVPTPYDPSRQSLESTNLINVNSSEVSNTVPFNPVSFAKMILKLEDDNPNRKHMAPPSMMSSIVGPTSTTPLSEVAKPMSLVQPLHPPSMLPSSISGPTSSVVTDKVKIKVGVANAISPKTQVPAGSRNVKPLSVEVPDFTGKAQNLFRPSPQGERKINGQSTIGQPTSLLTSKVLAPPSQVYSTLKAKDTPLLRSTSIASVRTKDPKSSNSPKSKKN